MIDVSVFMDAFISALNKTFGERLWFVGLQGSYGRGEATESSDIDTVVILDELTSRDVRAYNIMLNDLPYRELICGFLSGKDELMNWEPSDLFQFYYDTQPILGSLDCILPVIGPDAVDRAIKTGVCNIYHGCVHNMLYEKSEDVLRGLYKSAYFVVQAVCFKETGKYLRRQVALRENVSADDRAIVDTFLHLKKGGDVSFDSMSDLIFEWCRKKI